jgi:hypothetical protein
MGPTLFGLGLGLALSRFEQQDGRLQEGVRHPNEAKAAAAS